MKVAGFQKNTFIDYPGKIASIVFLGGCNMRCYYCHNSQILTQSANSIDFDEVLEQIKKQKGFIDGVVISGGEPTLHPNLLEIIRAIKELDLLVKLDTNGAEPELLKQLVNDGLVDYVAMDVKAPLGRYADIVGTGIDITKVEESIKFLKGQTKVDYMFRTTLAPMLVEDDILLMAQLLKGSKTFQLQQFVPNEFSNSQKIIRLPYKQEDAKKFAVFFAKYIDNVLLRGW